MAGRGPQTFQKRQKEQQRKEKQMEKRAKRLERKREGPGAADANAGESIETDSFEGQAANPDGVPASADDAR